MSPISNPPVVECRELVVRYGDRTAVDGLSVTAAAGEVVALLGPNGAGKTSTVECLEGYRHPAAGTVRVLGLDPAADHRYLVRRVGVMLQRGGVYPMLSPRRAAHLFATYYPKPEDPEQLLDLVGLAGVANTPWRHLSGGEQQRLSLALALVGRPEVVFLDEPTAGVDPEGRLAVRRVIIDLAQRGVCVVLTTHELAEAERVAHRVVIVRRGQVVAEGTAQQLAALGAGGGPAITFAAPSGLDTAALGVALGTPVTEVAAGQYRVNGAPSPTLTATLATWLAERDAVMTDLRSAQSLEDTYLAIVGDSEEPAPAADESTSRRGRDRAARRGDTRR